MIRNGTARRSDSPYASPLHIVPKKEDGWRPCGDYRALNARTVPDQYPVRHIIEFARQFAGRKVFSTVELVKAYTRSQFLRTTSPRQPSSRPSDSSNSRICPSGSEMQRFIDEVLRDLEFCYAYIDDVLVDSTSEDEQSSTCVLCFSALASKVSC
jgi:hypothetical protein